MVMPPSVPQNVPGYDIDQLLQTVSQLETVGLLEDFLTSHPQYLIGIEVARALLDRGRANRNPGSANGEACGRGPVAPIAQQPGGGGAVAHPAVVPSAPSVRYFVTLLSRLLEDQCPNRGDPHLIASEDRCLAALQMSIVDALKTVRQRRLSGAQGPLGIAGVPTQHGVPPNSACQRAVEGEIPQQQRPEGFSQFHPHHTVPHVLAAGPPGTNMMTNPLHQRIEQIPEPLPCLLQHPGDHAHVSYTQPPPIADGLTLEQRLQIIPQPMCYHLECQGRNNSCGIFSRTIHSHERDTVGRFFDPVAGGWSDGMGGHKVKNHFDTGKKKPRNAGDDDGVGGRKVKSSDGD